MGKMKVVAQLVEEGDKEMLVDYLLKGCSFNGERGAIKMAEELLEAKEQLEEEGIWNNPFKAKEK
tara:strand:+ start:2273 stop:2467 length:195 start_codon:yes stop_codon:yes gene_type:complete